MSPKELIEFYEQLTKLVYERAYYLRCIKDDNMVPMEFRRNNLNKEPPEPEPELMLAQLAQMIINEEPSSTETNQNTAKNQAGANEQTVQIAVNSKSAISQSKSNFQLTSNLLKSGSKVAITEDPALDILKTILKYLFINYTCKFKKY